MDRHSSEQDGVEKRRAFRCPVLESAGSATLRVHETAFPVQILDESATGFAVLSAQPPGVEAGQVARLETSVWLHEVRVAHVVTKPSTEPDAEEPDGEGPEPVYRIGLERLRDIAVVDDERNWFRWRPPQRFVARAGLAGLLCAIVTAAVLGSLIAGCPQSLQEPRSEEPPSNTARSAMDRIIRSQQTARPDRKKPSLRADSPRKRQKPDTASQRSSPRPKPGGDSSGMDDPIGRLPGAAALVLSDVAIDLGLSEAQRGRIRTIVDATDHVVRQAGQEQKLSNPQEYARQHAALLEEARRQALSVLTPDQRSRWETRQQKGNPREKTSQ